MSEREELEAVIDGLRAAQKRLYDDAEPHEGGRPFGAMVRGADAMGEAARKLKALSSHLPKGNGELVEAVRECLAYFELMNVTGSLPDQCRAALSDSEGVATSGGDAGREEDALTGLREVLACVRSDGIPASLGVRLCPDQFNRYHPVVKKVAKAIEESTGDEISSAQAAIRTIWALGEPAARSAAQDTQRAERATNGDHHDEG